MTRAKVVHMSSAHTPFDTRIFLKECRTLAEAGYETVFVVPHDQDVRRDGVQIRAVEKQAAGRLRRMTGTVRRVYRAAVRERAEVYHFHDPELIPAGLLLKLRGKRVIYDVHEDLPRQILSKHWIPRPVRRVVAFAASLLEGIGARCFDGIVTATPAIARRFPVRKTQVVQNFPLLGELEAPGAKPYHAREAVIAYVGGISAIRGVREVIEALALLPASLNVRLALAGSFSPPELEQELRQIKGWERVDFLGWQSREEVRDLLARSRAGVVTFHPVPNHTESQPNKLFEYMSAGLPVIASHFPFWEATVGRGEAACGLLTDPQDPFAIAQTLCDLLADEARSAMMGQRGAAAVQTRYNWEAEGRLLVQLYERLSMQAEEMQHGPESLQQSEG